AVASAGVTSAERKAAKQFLQGQLKAIEPDSKGAEIRTAKLKELMSGVEAATSREEPAHVKKAKQAVAAAEKAFETVSKNYESWEKGKKMLSVDDLKILKRSYDDGKKKVDNVRSFVDQQLALRSENAAAPLKVEAERGAAAMNVDAATRTKAGKGTSNKANPTVRVAPAVVTPNNNPRPSGGGGGYPSAAAAPAPNAAALRQAQLSAQVRLAAEADAAEAASARPRPAIYRPTHKPEEPARVLSYACTCMAVAEQLGIKEAKAKEMAESSKEFAAHFDAATWENIQIRSLAIEKANREKAKENEKRKQLAALARVTEVQASAAASPNGPPPPPRGKVVAPKAVPGGFATVAPKAKPK
ncbi:unnamed protein product, partial [Polarella glacialis]